jgi:Zn-dependent protease/CBS domain-containing protein
VFTKGFDLGEIFGFRIRVDYSWFIIAVLIAWTLAAYSLPSLVEQIRHFTGSEAASPTSAVYWALGIVGTVLFFASVLGHELSHALVARQFGVEMRGITLFIFGGVAEMTDEPPSANAELQVAIAGPVASFLFAFLFAGGAWAAYSFGMPLAVTAAALYLGLVNAMLAVFNLIPAFPLDGGRVLRSVLWRLWGDLRRATRITSSLGSMFGLAMILFGIVGVFSGNIFALWWALIGLFVRNAAQMSYQQLLLRRVLEGEPVSRFMQPDPVTVPRHISVEELVEHYVYKHHFKMFPVVDDGRLVGCVTTRQIKELPREEWDRTSVGVLAKDCSAENSVEPSTDAMEALGAMSRSGLSRLMVVDSEGRLAGILSLKDLLDFFALKIELESG